MIDPEAVITYAQYNEDIILRALLGSVKKGYYIDVGANHPVIDSVTKYFYDEGWSGINIEPIPRLHKEFVKDRKRDVNLQCGLGDKHGELMLREYIDRPGHSTFDAKRKNEQEGSLESIDYIVPVITLNEVFDKYVKGERVDFIKIDVEGFESNVVKGNNWDENRPIVICIETNHSDRSWERIIKGCGYNLFIGDGLNEYYIAKESEKLLTEGFAEKAALLDYHALKEHHFSAWKEDSKEIDRLKAQYGELDDQIRASALKISQLETLATLSPKNQPLRRRIILAVYGLTVDWLRFKFQKGK
jgi:FkbM family methyltransferase